MGKREQETALNLIHSLMQYDFSSDPIPEQLSQVDQGYGVTIQMLEALAKNSNDPRLQSLANVVIQAWKH